MIFPPIRHAATIGAHLGLVAPFTLAVVMDRGRRVTLAVCAALLLPVGAAIPVTVAVLEWQNPHYVADAAVLLGRGEPVPEATVALANCRSGGRGGGGGRVSPRCDVVISAADGGRTYELSSITPSDRPLGVVRVFGQLRARWSWYDMVGNLVFFPLLLAFLTAGVFGFGWWGGRQALRGHPHKRITHGAVQLVDLLSPTWDFAWTDARGRRRYDRSATMQVPLIVDGVNSVALAIVQGSRAVLLDHALATLVLTPEQRAHALERAQALQAEGRVRPPLPPVAGEPPDQAARLAQVEQWANGGRDEQAKAYRGAWRLVWDAETLDISQRAAHLRDLTAARLGKRRTDALLQACRAQAAQDLGPTAHYLRPESPNV